MFSSRYRPLFRPISHTFSISSSQLCSSKPQSAEGSMVSVVEDSSRGHFTDTNSRKTRLQRTNYNIWKWAAVHISELRDRTHFFTSLATVSMNKMGRHFNRLTGYEEIEAWKRRVADNELRMANARLAARSAKKAFEDAVNRRSMSQRLVNDLLQRKSTWTDQDVSQFTLLVREDHSIEQAEARAKNEVAVAEDVVEKEFNELMRSILARYHEEQIWSDKIRSASTYGSLAVLSLNVIIFLLAIVVVEPWKRQRLVETFEDSVKNLNEANQIIINDSLKVLAQQLEMHEKILESLVPSAITHSFNRGITEDHNTDSKKLPVLAITIENKYQNLFYAGIVAGVAIGSWLLGSRFG